MDDAIDTARAVNRAQRRKPVDTDWTFSPGVHLLECMFSRFAQDFGLELDEFAAIVRGDKPIDHRISRLLRGTFGTSADYWLNSSRTYQDEKAGKRDDTRRHILTLLGWQP